MGLNVRNHTAACDICRRTLSESQGGICRTRSTHCHGSKNYEFLSAAMRSITHFHRCLMRIALHIKSVTKHRGIKSLSLITVIMRMLNGKDQKSADC